MCFVKRVIHLFLALAALSPLACLGAPMQWSGNGNYYELVGQQLTWEDARTAAQTRLWQGSAGHLATVTSDDESDFLFTNLAVQGDHYWLGGYQPNPSAAANEGWVWVTGELWQYENWFVGEPNDHGGGEDSLVFQGVRNGMWNDGTGTVLSATVGYIVEYEITPVPIPDTSWLLWAGLFFFAARRLSP